MIVFELERIKFKGNEFLRVNKIIFNLIYKVAIQQLFEVLYFQTWVKNYDIYATS